MLLASSRLVPIIRTTAVEVCLTHVTVDQVLAASVLAQMSCQVTRPRILLLADGTLVGSFARMRQHVFAQVAR